MEPGTSVTTVCLVRHGQTDSNFAGRLQGREDRELNAQGEEQVRQSAVYLARQHWDVLATSPTRRARQTAGILAEHLGMSDIEEMHEFVAREPGAAYNLTRQEIEERFPDGNVPGSESREDVRERAMGGLNKLASKYPGKNMLVVAHREGINSILRTISGGEIGTGVTQLAIGSLSFLELRDGEWKIIASDVTEHLQTAP